MSESPVRRLTRDELDRAGHEMFVLKRRTLGEIAADCPLAVLGETCVELYSDASRMLDELPDGAFAAQPDDPDGNDVWSAGDVARHLVEMEILSIPFWEAILELRLEAPDEQILELMIMRTVDRPRAIAAVRAIRDANRTLVSGLLSRDVGDRTATHFAVGPASAHGALLATCVHTMDHVRQLEGLGRSSA